MITKHLANFAAVAAAIKENPKLKFYVLGHTHQHGWDAHFLLSEEIPDEEDPDLIEALGIDFEPERDETLSLINANQIHLITHAEQPQDQEAQSQPPPLPSNP